MYFFLQATFVQEIVHGIVWRLVHIIAHEDGPDPNSNINILKQWFQKS